MNDWLLNTSYPYGALSEQMLPPASTFLTPRFRTVLHLVRTPMEQISAVTSHSERTYGFVARFVQKVLFSEGVMDPKVVTQFAKVIFQCFICAQYIS